MHHNTVTLRVACQGCQVFKTHPISTQSIAFWGGSTGKSCIPGGKIQMFRRGSPGQIRTPGAKYQVFGGNPQTWQHCSLQTWCFLWRLLRPIRVCHQSTARALRERTSPYAFSCCTLMSYMIDRQVEHTSCHVTDCNHSLCGWKLCFFISRNYRKCN